MEFPILNGFLELYKQLEEKDNEIARLKDKVAESRELYQTLNRIHELVSDVPSVCEGCGDREILTWENTEYSNRESGKNCVCEHCYGVCGRCGDLGELVEGRCNSCYQKLQGGVN